MSEGFIHDNDYVQITASNDNAVWYRIPAKRYQARSDNVINQQIHPIQLPKLRKGVYIINIIVSASNPSEGYWPQNKANPDRFYNYSNITGTGVRQLSAGSGWKPLYWSSVNYNMFMEVTKDNAAPILNLSMGITTGRNINVGTFNCTIDVVRIGGSYEYRHN